MSDNIDNFSWDMVPNNNEWTGVWTRDRPPHLNDDNFPSQVHALTHKIGEQQSTVDDTMEHDLEAITLGSGYPEDNYAPSSGTSNSDSTITGYTVKDRSHLLMYYIRNNPLDVKQQDLTAEALQAFNNGNANHGYLLNLHTWCQDGYMFNADDTKMSDSMIMAKHPKSHATQATLSSAWSIIPDISHQERSGENVSGVGGLFDEVVAPPMIMDEDDFVNVTV